MSWRFRNIALAALCCALTTGLSAWADTPMTNPVTGETETYANVFTSGTEWNDAANWDTSTTPFISGNYDPALVDGNTVSTSTAIDGYQLRVGAYNSASVTWSGGITKIQAGSTGCWLTADETSLITIASFAGNQLEGSDSAPFKLYSANAGGITWSAGITDASNTTLPFWYYLKGSGTVVYGGDITVANAQVIKQADITLSGSATKSVQSKTLVTFGSGTTKIFAADATIKRLNSSGVDLASDAHLSVVNTSGETSLTTSDGVGKCELVQTSTGIVLYWVDGDPAALAPTVYRPSISVNFTSGTDLSTTDDVGIGDYAIPGTSWNNLIGNNGSLATVTGVDTNGSASTLYGAKVTISGTRGYYTRSGLDAASELRQGYIDDNDNNTSPTVVVEGIPYNSYKVVIICSSDNNTTKFGYMTVNGTHYKGGSGTTETCSGTDSDIWGSASDSTWIEGDNFLVTPEIANTDGKLTIVSHRMSGCRAGLAAIQVVEVAPTKTENDLVINVSGDTDYSVDETKALSGTVYVTGNGTLTLSGSSKITAASIDVGPLVTINANADRLDATAYTGLGTVVYSDALPPSDKGWTDSAWTGTVWINGKSGVTDFNVNSYGNANSAVKLSGVDGWVSAPGNYTYTNSVPVILENGTFDYALKLTNGNSPNSGNPVRCTAFVKVSGSGTIADGNAANPMIKIFDGSDFTGTITLTRAKVVFCSATSTTLPESYFSGIATASIYVDSGISVTVPSDKVWSATGGIKVDGELSASGLARFGDTTTITTTDNGIFTLTDSNSTQDHSVDYARITGTGTLRYADATGWRSLSRSNFPTGMICENNLSAGLILQAYGQTHTIGSLSGSGQMRSDWDGSGSTGDRDLRILQAKDTTYSGLFASSNDRIDEVYVAPGESTAGTLTLSGAQTASNGLIVETGASVNLTGTWVGDATVSGTFGGTGTLNGDLTFSEGSTNRVFASDTDGLVVTGTLTCPATGTVKVDVSGIDLEGVYYLPILSGLTSADPEKFELVDSSIPFGFVFAGGELGLERKSDYLELYHDYVTFTLNNIGTTPITNYTLLVRISTAQLPGFSYERAGDGSKIAFSDGHGAPLVHEIDTWNTHGESLVWVKVPEAVNGTQVKFYWSLKDGADAPANDPTAVWSDYTGVWHMGKDGLDETGLNTFVKTREDVEERVGQFGNALGASSAQGDALLTFKPGDALEEITNSEFTVSYWVNFDNDNAHLPYLFGRLTAEGNPGYGVRLYYRGDTSKGGVNRAANGGTSIAVYHGGGSNIRWTCDPGLIGLGIGTWVRMDVVYGGTSIKIFVNGIKQFETSGINPSQHPIRNGDADFGIGGLVNGANYALVGAIDEFRIHAGGVDTALLAAEIANANFSDYCGALEGDGVSFLVPGTVVRDGVAYDYWVKSPTVTPTYWNTNDVPAVVTYTEGVLRSGSSVTNWCENLLTHEEYDVSSDTLRSLPGGTYCIHCKTEGAFEIDEDERKVYFTIVKDSGTASAGDTAGGRILLMNNDFSQGGTADEPTIGSQGYSDTNETAAVYWQFADRTSSGITTMNVMDGTNSILWSVSDDKSVTNKLWHLVASRHGNTYPSDGSGLDDSQNYLPWSTMSCSLTNGTVVAQSGADAGQILMLNTTEAAVYSPCYDEGIGTIYFDAVNGWNDDLTAYQLIVEYATATTNGDPVVDANLWQYDDDGNVTNYYGNLDATCWQACEVNVARVTGGDTVNDPVTYPRAFNLEVESGRPTTTGEFYRVYAKLNVREPVRFRIRRTSIDGAKAATPDSSYLLLDNIIVSYPAMGATLSPAGWYDETKKGANVVGFEGAFTKAFPAVGDTVHGKAVVDYYVNSSQHLTETNFFASATMNYRWRYLKNVSEWKSVALDPDDDFRSAEPLELPDEVGDIEFWYEYVLQAPYYSYADYTGLPNLENAFAAKYSEATLGPQTNRSTKVDFSYPTFGNDWFVRLRASSSSNEVWRVFVRNADGSAYSTEDGTVEYIDLAVTDTGSWRGFLRTPAAVEGGLEYRVEQINPQADDADFAFSTNYWKGVAVFADTIKSVNLTAAGIDEWSTVPCAATTGFMMFVLDEGTPSLSVTSADLQNFDKWNDANKNDRLFVGTSAEDNAKSGVSHTMRTYEAEFDMWAPSVATNQYWIESFKENWTRYVEFGAGTKTPNGWTAGSGMWIYEKYKDNSSSDSMALQMAGRGDGYLTFANAGERPRGIESISFRSRLAQSASLADFGYNENVHKGLTNYTFVVQAAMSTNAVTSGGAWDAGFDGLGQISVLGGYRVNKGGYELRITRWKEKRYRAELCRWVGDVCTVVKECEADLDYDKMPYTIINGSDYPTLFISVDYQSDGSCKVQAGFSGEAGGPSGIDGTSNGHSASGVLPSTGNYITFSYTDTAPPTSYGTYGLASANCDAVFAGARFYGKAAGGFDDSDVFKRVACNGFDPGSGATSESEDIDGDWALPVRLTYDTTAKKIFSVADEQPLVVQWKLPEEGDLEWKDIATTNISSYTLSDTITIPVLLKEDAYVRIKHGGARSDKNCVDIVVDDVTIRQWRGDDYDNTKTQTYFRDVLYGSPTNFVFTSAWLNDEGSVELTAARAATNEVSSLRSPLMDGESGRGVGLGMFSFSYTNADSRAVLSLQIATNVTMMTLAEYTKLAVDDSRWQTVTNFEFSAMSEDELAGGVLSCYLGMHGVKGAMRLVVDPDTAVAADAAKDAAYGRIFITQVICRDEPSLDSSCWWGWNIRTGEDLYSADDKLLMNLSDWPGSGGADAGMSFALNNSVVDDTETSDPTTYRQHQPFLQTPIFTNNTAVGEITFKARRYDMPSELTPRVCIYGANPSSGHVDTSDDANWTYVTHFDVTNDFYRTYTKKFKGASYETLRLVVVGVDNVAQKHGKPTSDAGYKDLKDVVRVALDDVVVTESLTPKLAFRNVFAFRGDESTDLLDTSYVDRFGDISAQPLAGEGWGVQAEIVAEQLPDEIDFDRGIEVTLYWYDGDVTPWGYSNWESKGGGVVHSAKLVKCDDKDLAFRSSFNDGHSGASIVGQLPEYPSGTIVQYMLRAAYYLKESDELQYTDLKQEQWTKPAWYRGIDFNATFGGFSAYTVLDSVAPGWAWINEANVFGGYESDDSTNRDRQHQYVEVAFPVEADLTNWRLEFVAKDTGDNTHTITAHTFTADPATGRTKTDNVASNCVYYVISSPDSKSNLEAMTVGGQPVKVDATWDIPASERIYFLDDDNSLQVTTFPVAMRLVRPSGIIEHAVTFEGTNFWYGIAGRTDRSAEAFADTLNAESSDSEWVAVGDDSIAGNHSLGVTNLAADVVANWNNTMARTPGFINENQKIDPKHPIANGASYIVYATFAEDSAGHITQTLGADVNTTSLAMAVVTKGFSTNITYNVENWYELASVKVDGAEQTLDSRTGTVVLTLGGPATSNNISVVASSRIAPTLAEDWGLTPDNRYTSAVVDWLNKGSTLRGAFANPTGPIAAAQFMPLSLDADDASLLSLTEMYWLDMDPTADCNGDGTNDWWLVGGMKVAPSPKIIADPPLTNIIMGACLYITNAAPVGYGGGASFAPYALRGVEAGSISTNYASGLSRSWDGPTFRIIGRLFEKVGDIEPTGDDEMGFIEWIALRWFVFDENSFRPKGASDEFQTMIEIVDPYSSESAAYIKRWYTRRGTSTIFYKWSIDDGGGLFATETLCPTNWLSK